MNRDERIKQLYDELEANTHSDHIKHAECANKRKEIQAELRKVIREERDNE